MAIIILLFWLLHLSRKWLILSILSFELAFKYRNPVMMLSDGAIGQMMEKVYLSPQVERIQAQFPIGLQLENLRHVREI